MDGQLGVCNHHHHHDIECKELTDKLRVYVNRLRSVRDSSYSESSAFSQSVEAMEMEIGNIKAMYDREIEKLRAELEEISKQKNQWFMRSNQFEQSVGGLQARVAAEVDANKRLNDDNLNLQNKIYRIEMEFQAKLRAAAATATSRDGGDEKARQLEQARRELAGLQGKCDAECLRRQELEDKCRALEEKNKFDAEISAQQIADLQGRLAAAGAAMAQMENSRSEVAGGGAGQEEKLREMIETMKCAADQELYKYKRDTDDVYNKKVGMLQSQLMNEKKSLATLEEENNKLTALIGELNGQIKSLQAQISQVQGMRGMMQKSLQAERDQALIQAQSMQKKLEDMQQAMFVKVRELNAARGCNLPLQAEIDSLRLYLEDEENRSRATESRLPPLGRTAHSNYARSGGFNTAAAISSLQRNTSHGGDQMLYLRNSTNSSNTRTREIFPPSHFSMTQPATGKHVTVRSQVSKSFN